MWLNVHKMFQVKYRQKNILIDWLKTTAIELLNHQLKIIL